MNSEFVKYRKISNVKVKPVDISAYSSGKVSKRWAKLFDEQYPNIFLCARKKSGKSTTVVHIVKQAVDKNSIVLIFSSTVHKDPTMRYLIDWLKKKNIPTIAETSIFDDEGRNQLQELTAHLGSMLNENGSEQKKEPEKTIILTDDDYDEEDDKPVEHNYLIIFDDLSEELQNKYITYLLKRNRHFKMRIILSSQWYNDISKGGRKQIDYIFAYPRLPDDKLDMLRKEAGIHTEKDQFQKIYDEATAPNEPGEKSFNFLYIDTTGDKFRRNFNEEIIIPQGER
jgi:hypothetical protein